MINEDYFGVIIGAFSSHPLTETWRDGQASSVSDYCLSFLPANANATVAALDAYNTVIGGGTTQYVAEGALSMYYAEGRNFETREPMTRSSKFKRARADTHAYHHSRSMGRTTHEQPVSATAGFTTEGSKSDLTTSFVSQHQQPSPRDRRDQLCFARGDKAEWGLGRSVRGRQLANVSVRHQQTVRCGNLEPPSDPGIRRYPRHFRRDDLHPCELHYIHVFPQVVDSDGF